MKASKCVQSLCSEFRVCDGEEGRAESDATRKDRSIFGKVLDTPTATHAELVP